MLSMIIEKAIYSAYHDGNIRFIEDMLEYSDAETSELINRYLVEELLVCSDCFTVLKRVNVTEVYGNDGVHDITNDIVQLYCRECMEEK